MLSILLIHSSLNPQHTFSDAQELHVDDSNIIKDMPVRTKMSMPAQRRALTPGARLAATRRGRGPRKVPRQTRGCLHGTFPPLTARLGGRERGGGGGRAMSLLQNSAEGPVSK